MEKFGGIDILVSNAATNPVYGGLLDVSTPLVQGSRAVVPGYSFLPALFLAKRFCLFVWVSTFTSRRQLLLQVIDLEINVRGLPEHRCIDDSFG